MLKKLETPGSIALLAGVVCYASALSVLVLAPEFLTDQSAPEVVGTDGVRRDVKPYAPIEEKGREIYGKQVCWHCHSQFVRPVNEEDKRWGPVSQTGEYTFDRPHFFGTRRTGPDLHREGGMRPDDWHFAHFLNPRFTVPLSVMPAFPWLFTDAPQADAIAQALSLLDTDGDGVLTTKSGFDEGGEPPAALKDAVAKARRAVASQDSFTRFDVRGIRGPGKSVDSMWWFEEPEGGEGLVTDRDGAPRPTEDAVAITAYLQRLGTNIGKWRRPMYAPTPTRLNPFDEVEPRPRRTADMRAYGFLAHDEARAKRALEARKAWETATAAWDARHPVLAGRVRKGKEVFDRHCAGCHGPEGRGNGPAAPSLFIRPRNFTIGKYKYRSTPVGAMPLDGDLYRSIFRGLPGSSMPSWKELSDDQIWLLVDYVKTFFEGDKVFNDLQAVLPISPPQRFDGNPALDLARGRAVYLAGQCYNCHGKEGRADGPGWNETADDWGAALRPRDLRPRIAPKDAPELWTLMKGHLERHFGAEAWKGLSVTPAWTALEPKDEKTSEAFVLFLLGEGPRVKAVFGEDALKKALGDRYDGEFDEGDDALEDLRMAVATEKDQPALRYRGGAHADDIYRTIMTGLEGTQMKVMFDFFWKKTEAKLEGRDDIPKRARRFVWTPIVGDEKKLSIVTNDPALRAVGVYVKANPEGKDEEFIKVQPGDDWALVRYVQWLSCIPRVRQGN
jgi:cytochrome c oxidase cbb3-type subunit I/II